MEGDFWGAKEEFSLTLHHSHAVRKPGQCKAVLRFLHEYYPQKSL